MEKECFAICSQHGCDYALPFNGFMLSVHLHGSPDTELRISEDSASVYTKNRFCEKCAAPLFFFCPHCKKALFSIPEPKFCGGCKKEIKPIDYRSGINEDGSF